MRWLVLFLILSTGFSLCTSPYINRFDTEFNVAAHELTEPLVVSILSEPGIQSRIEYGIVRRTCKLDSSDVSKLVKISVGVQLGQKGYQQLLKKIGLSVSKNAVTKAAVAYFVSEAVIDMGFDALSPRAMAYQDILYAIRRSIELGLADAKAEQNSAACEKLESAAKIYYTYSYTDYRRDVCGSSKIDAAATQALKLVDSATRMSDKTSVSSVLELERREQMGSLARTVFPDMKTDSKSDKEIATEMVQYLKQRPSCSLGFDEQIQELESLARASDPGFFHAFLAVWSSMRSCEFHNNIKLNNKTLIYGYEQEQELYGFLIPDKVDDNSSLWKIDSDSEYVLIANYSVSGLTAEIAPLSDFSGNITLAFDSGKGWVEKNIELTPEKTVLTKLPEKSGVWYFEDDTSGGKTWIWAGLALIILFWFWRKDNEVGTSDDALA